MTIVKGNASLSSGQSAWLSDDLWLGLYSRAALAVVQLAFAIWGIVAWKKKSPSA